MTTADDNAHWIEVVDGHGRYPVKVLGPYANAQLADRARRGVLRLLIHERYSAVVLSQQELGKRPSANDCLA